MTASAVLFICAFIYFWAHMFEGHPRVQAILAGGLLIGSAGILLKPGMETFYYHVTAYSMSAIVLRRAWLTWRG